MKAIQVRYLPVTTHQPSRWKAFTHGGLFVIVPNNDADPRVAALALIKMMGWRSIISGEGQLPCGDFVYTLSGIAEPLMAAPDTPLLGGAAK